MGRRKKLINNTDIPQHKIEAIARCIMPDILAFYESEEGQWELVEWKSNGRRRSRRPTRHRDEKGGRTVNTAAPALFAFMGSASFSLGLSAWRSACAPIRCGNGWLRSGHRKQ